MVDSNSFNSDLKEERIPISRRSFFEKKGSSKISTFNISEIPPSTGKERENISVMGAQSYHGITDNS